MFRPPPLLLGTVLVCAVGAAAIAAGSNSGIGDTPTIEEHISQADILAGKWSFDRLFEAGRRLFVAQFNRLDGAGRP